MKRLKDDLKTGISKICAILLLGLMSGSAVAFGESTGRPAPSEPRTLPTAEELLRTLQRKRPANQIIVPTSRQTRSLAETTAHRLAPEGYPFVDYIGVFSQAGGLWTFTTVKGEPLTLKVLPNALLEVAVRTSRGAKEPVHFKVAGELTVYEKENYLFLRSLLRASDGASAEVIAVPAPKAASRDAPSAVQPSAEDVLSRMQGLEPSAGLVRGAEAAKSPLGQSEGGEGRASGLLIEGSFLANRPGRPVKQGDCWVLIPESNRPDSVDATFKLLPSQGLESMSKAAERGTHGLVYLVSGEITVFEDENYLLPRSAVRRGDLGNLRP